MLWRFIEGADERLPWLAESKDSISVYILGMELNLNGIPNSVIHVSSFSGEDGGIVKLNAVTRVDLVFSYGCFV
jgi:hypothetical protein